MAKRNTEPVIPADESPNVGSQTNGEKKLSVCICTHNRAAYLERALDSLLSQTVPASEFQVVVVDNASTDRTRQVVEEYGQRLPCMRYVYEGRLGLSQARNTAMETASSQYVAYLDDDARAEPEWVESLVESFETVTPPPACVGGKVWLDWEGGLPTWLPKRYWSVYTHLDKGDQGGFLGRDDYLVGANMAFRKDVLQSLGGFDTHLGRRGKSLLSGEEAALVHRLHEHGYPVYYAPKAAVWHTVPKSRARPNWLVRRMFWDGASQPLLDYGADRPRSFYWSQSYRDARALARLTLQWVRTSSGRSRKRRLESTLALVQRLGRLRTSLLLSLGRI